MLITAPLVIYSNLYHLKIKLTYFTELIPHNTRLHLHGGNSMKARPLICLLLLIFLASYSCTQQPEKKSASEQKSHGNVASAKKQPAKVNYLKGEIISISLKTNNLIIRGKDGDFEVSADKKTIIKTGSDDSKLSDISSGNKATVRYITVEDKNIARSIFIAQETGQEDELLKSGNAPAEPQRVIPPDRPPILPEKQWPSS